LLLTFSALEIIKKNQPRRLFFGVLGRGNVPSGSLSLFHLQMEEEIVVCVEDGKIVIDPAKVIYVRSHWIWREFIPELDSVQLFCDQIHNFLLSDSISCLWVQIRN